MSDGLTLSELLVRYGGLCVYCGDPIVRPKDLEAKGIEVKTSHHFAFYIIDGVKYKTRRATIDHVIDREHGGSSADYNLVPACVRCNQWKASLKRRKLPHNKVCRRCKAKLRGKRKERRYCRKCREALKKEWTAKNGPLPIRKANSDKGRHNERIDSGSSNCRNDSTC